MFSAAARGTVSTAVVSCLLLCACCFKLAACVLMSNHTAVYCIPPHQVRVFALSS